MKSSVLFVPLPRTFSQKCDFASIGRLFPGSENAVLSLSQQIRSRDVILNSFVDYSSLLYSKLGGMLYTTWSDPFNPNNCIPSQLVETELTNCIWNQICCLEEAVLKNDCQSSDGLKNIRAIISDIHACVINFNKVIQNIRHPIFNNALGQFLTYYHEYLDAAWMMNVVEFSKKGSLLAKTISGCLAKINDCLKLIGTMNNNTGYYLQGICKSIQAYLFGKINLEIGNECIVKNEFGKAIRYFQNGINCLNNFQNNNKSNFISVETAISLLKEKLNNLFQSTKSNNSKIYQQIIPNDVPQFPPPPQKQLIEPNQSLILNDNTIQNVQQINNFSEWDKVISIKGKVGLRLQQMKNQYNFSNVCTELERQMFQAQSSDNIIINAMNYYGKIEGLQKQAIEVLIGQALVFYENVDERLNILENQYI